MRKREINKQLKTTESQYKKSKSRYDLLENKDSVIGRYYKANLDKDLRKIEDLKAHQ